MSEEEKEAIRYIQDEIKDLLKTIEYYKDMENILEKEEVHLKQTILNLIDKLQKENKKLNLENQALFESINCNDDNMLARRYSNLQKELEEKTTILMAGADKVKQLEKENQELKRCIDAQKIMRKDMPKDTKLILMYSEDYKRIFKEE